jgi:hypothetical protein
MPYLVLRWLSPAAAVGFGRGFGVVSTNKGSAASTVISATRPVA